MIAYLGEDMSLVDDQVAQLVAGAERAIAESS
jgi:hypothetical protein